MEQKCEVKILPAGDSCLMVDFGNIISIDINSRVQALRKKLEKANFPQITELVPTYRSLAVYFEPSLTDIAILTSRIRDMVPCGIISETASRKTITIPVCYGGEYGPDLGYVASYNDLSQEDVIRIHTGSSYYCYMHGFTPGFPYLGGMDDAIATPRLDHPRESIPGGSVGIAGKQTGVYPIDSPGGWQLIGKTPLKMFDPQRTPPAIMDAGLWVRFKAVSEKQFLEIREKAVSDQFCADITEEEISNEDENR